MPKKTPAKSNGDPIHAITVRLPEELFRRLHAFSAKHYVSYAEGLRKLIEDLPPAKTPNRASSGKPPSLQRTRLAAKKARAAAVVEDGSL